MAVLLCPEAFSGIWWRGLSYVAAVLLLVGSWRMGICPQRAGRDDAAPSPGWTVSCQCRRRPTGRSWELVVQVGTDGAGATMASTESEGKTQWPASAKGRGRATSSPSPASVTVPALRASLREKGLPVGGLKADLEERLRTSEGVPARPELSVCRERVGARAAPDDAVQGVPPVVRQRP